MRKIKHFTSLATVLLLLNYINSYSQCGHLWSKSNIGYSNYSTYSGEWVSSMASDNNGNIYVVGYFYSDSISFDSHTIINNTSSTYYSGSTDLFIVKYDSQGNVVWAKNAVCDYDDVATNICIDNTGNIYITGRYSNNISFGTFTLTTSSQSMFIVKYNPNGDVLWAKDPINGGVSGGYDIIMNNNNLIVVGRYVNGNITFGSYTLPNSSSTNIFFTKYDTNGNVVWAKNIEGEFGNYLSKNLSIDNNNDFYFIGEFSNTTINIDTITLTNKGGKDILIAKFSQNGDVIWAKNIGNDLDEISRSIYTDSFDNTYFAGEFKSDSICLDSSIMYNRGGSDAFLIKFDSNGNEIWEKHIGSDYWDYVNGITTDSIGNVYLAGYFQSDSLVIDSIVLYNIGSSDIYMAKYNINGNLIWAKCIGGNGSDGTGSIISDNIDNIYLSGYYYSDSLDFGNTSLVNTGGSDIYITKFKYFNYLQFNHIDDANNNCIGEASVIVSGDSYPPFTYLWNDQSQQTTPIATNLCYGTYTVTVTDINGCITIDSVHINNITSIIEKDNSDNQFVIFPVPCKKNLFIRKLSYPKNEDIYLELYNSVNKLVLRNKLTSSEILYKIDVSQYSSGVYLLKIKSKNCVLQFNKIIIQK